MNYLSEIRKHAQILLTLHHNARPFPENDIWIAAIAIEHDLRGLNNGLILNDRFFEQFF